MTRIVPKEIYDMSKTRLIVFCDFVMQVNVHLLRAAFPRFLDGFNVVTRRYCNILGLLNKELDINDEMRLTLGSIRATLIFCRCVVYLPTTFG